MKLAGKVAIVTGGGTGIGLGICRVFVKHGASIVIAQLDASTADKAMASLEGADVSVCQVDVADRAQMEDRLWTGIEQAATQIFDRHNPVHWMRSLPFARELVDGSYSALNAAARRLSARTGPEVSNSTPQK